MKNVKQSFSWLCFENRGVDPITLLHEAKKIGYLGVDLLPPEFWGDALDSGLMIVNIERHRPLEQGLNLLENHDYLESEVLMQMELTARLRLLRPL